MIIFTKTCAQHLDILYYMVRSVERHVTGYSKHIVVTDAECYAKTVEVCLGAKHVEVHTAARLPCAESVVRPYLRQQYVKLMADFYTEETNIFQLDSDMIVERPFNLQRDHKWMRVHRDEMHPGIRDHWDTRWWKTDQRVLRSRSEYAYMYSGCGWHTQAGVLLRVRAYLQDLWGRPLHELLNNASIDENFSEYQTYGRLAEYFGFLRMPYAFHQGTTPLYPEVWTYSGDANWTTDIRKRLAAAIGEEPRP